MDENRPLPCPHAKKCGGCQLQHLPYERQLAQKQRRAQELLDGFGPVLPILGMEEPTHYRNKVTAAFALDRNRKVVSGIYQPGSHAVVPVDDCLIEDRAADAILVTIRRMLPDFRIRVYDERSGTGWLRHVLVRRGFATGQALVVLVAASPVFPTQKPFVKALTEKHPEITSVVLNVNDRFGPVVLGAREKVLYGDGYIEDILCSHRFRISPRSFYQINPVQTEKLYRTAVDFAGLTGTETVLDAYCGVGTIGITASAHAGQVVGVELNRDAVADAIANARLNGIKNCWFTAGDAGAYMEQMARDGMRPDLVFLDPPRAGRSGDAGAGSRASCRGRLPGAKAPARGYVPLHEAYRMCLFAEQEQAGARRRRKEALSIGEPGRSKGTLCCRKELSPKGKTEAEGAWKWSQRGYEDSMTRGPGWRSGRTG